MPGRAVRDTVLHLMVCPAGKDSFAGETCNLYQGVTGRAEILPWQPLFIIGIPHNE
jgi:hypothetical protein